MIVNDDDLYKTNRIRFDCVLLSIRRCKSNSVATSLWFPRETLGRQRRRGNNNENIDNVTLSVVDSKQVRVIYGHQSPLFNRHEVVGSPISGLRCRQTR